MRLLALSLLLGDMLFQQLSELPPFPWLAPLIVAGLFYSLVTRSRPLAGVALGFFLAQAHAEARLEPALAPELEGREVVVIGRIDGLPQRRPGLTRFIFEVERLEADGRPHPAPRRLRLSWYGEAPPLHAGERWGLRLRLKRPHGFMNPGGFDYEGWLFRRGIGATGYVRAPAPGRLAPAPPGIDRLRQHLVEAVESSLPPDSRRAVILALTVGERSGLTDEQWALLRRTGTSHLMAISGLHIGLVAGLCMLCLRALWPRLPGLGERLAAPRAAALAGLAGAGAYALVAGLSVPTQRALIMLAVALGAVWLRRPVQPLQGLAAALTLILIIDPLAVLSAGFWLSFGAVAIILYGFAGRARRPGGAPAWGRLQLGLALGLLPLGLTYFQQAPLLAPLANLLLVPWVGLVVVPLSLTGVLLLPLASVPGGLLLRLADLALAPVWPLLEFLAALPGASWTQHAPPAWSLPLAALGVVLLLAPRGWPGRLPGLVLLAVPVLTPPPRPAEGEAWLTVLDVGQGLAVVVETRGHDLVFDTGPRYTADFNAGEAAVLPYLRARGRSRIDTLVVSHGDSDHSGGAAALLEALPVGELLEGPGFSAGGEPCMAGRRWEWDGVRFELLHPPPGWNGDENNGSCVLRIEAGGQAALLAADLERAGEGALLAGRGRGALRAEVLLVPHHGSRSSSSAAFIAAVAPELAVVSAGYRNRWGFPHPEVVARYRAAGARVLNTVEQGALRVVLGRGEAPQPAPGMRLSAKRYWHHSPRL